MILTEIFEEEKCFPSLKYYETQFTVVGQIQYILGIQVRITLDNYWHLNVIVRPGLRSIGITFKLYF